jgi:hypothetical protein
VRGYIEKVGKKFRLDKVAACQKILEIVRYSQCSHEFLIYDLAEIIGMSGAELLNSKTLRLSAKKIIEN